MRTLWVGIRRLQVRTRSNTSHDFVDQMVKHHRTITISEKLVLRAIRKDGEVIGIGMVIVQSARPDEVFSPDRYAQYKWLTQSQLREYGIGPMSAILFFEEEADPVPDAPYVWK